MSSIQDRIRRLQSATDDDADELPATGTVAAAKAKLSRASADERPPSDAAPPKVSSIANRFTGAAAAESKEAPPPKVSNVANRFASADAAAADANEPPKVSNIANRFASADAERDVRRTSVSEMRERLAPKESPAVNVGARTAAIRDKANAPDSSGQVNARRDALQARSASGHAASGVAARAGRFDRATSEDAGVSGMVGMRAAKLTEERPSADAGSAPAAAPAAKVPSTPKGLASRAALFEGTKPSEEPSAEKKPSRVAAVQAAFTGAPKEERDGGQPKMGKVASAAKDRDLHEVREELADMVEVSKELLSELASLRAGMREMEKTRIALIKRVEALERKPGK